MGTGSLYDSPSRREALAPTHIFLLLAIFVAARLLFLYWLPEGTYSADVDNWIGVNSVFASGGNPYNATGYLNWPPFWMQIIFAAGRVASALHVQLVNVLRCVLVTVESGILLLTYAVLCRYCSPKRSFWLTLGAIALNPISILLTCQHCNFDVFVGFFVLLALHFSLRFNQGGSQIDWLWACACVGLGVLTKTVPLVLIPAMAFGVRRLNWSSRILGALLLLGPVSLGISIIYVLGPQSVSEKVILYRSCSGWFGITGLLSNAHKPDAIEAYTRFFPKGLMAFLLLWTILALRRSRPKGEELPLYFLGLLAAVPALGPGYGPQYIYWFLAFLPIVFAATSARSVRAAIVLYFVVAIGTYITEYAMFQSHGSFWVRLHPTPELSALSGKWSTQSGQVRIRLPLFYSWILLLLAVFGRAGKSLIRNSGC